MRVHHIQNVKTAINYLTDVRKVQYEEREGGRREGGREGRREARMEGSKDEKCLVK